MTKTTQPIKFATYHANICTDIGYMFIMTINQSVKQINIMKYFLHDYLIYWKRSQHILVLKPIISIVLA